MGSNINTIKTAGGPPTIKPDSQVTTKSDLERAYTNLGYMGDVALTGLGVGTAWYAVKKMIEHSYRKRLEKAIRDSATVEDFYKSRTAPIENKYIGAPKTASIKTARERFIDPGTIGKTTLGATTKRYIQPLPGQGTKATIATMMANNPMIFNTLAVAALPALFAGSMWAGNAASKAINDLFEKKDLRHLDKEKEEARKRYEDAALTLRNVSLGGLKKSGAANMEKEGGVTTLAILGGLGLLGAGGLYYYSQQQHDRPGASSIPVQTPDLTSNGVLNTLLGLGIGGAGLLAIPSIYRFVQSARRGYDKRVEGISDVTRAAQAWDAVRNSRGEDFATLRASLAEEPETLNFEAHGKKKPKRNGGGSSGDPSEPVPYANYFS